MTDTSRGTAASIIPWVAQLVPAAILGMAAVPKLAGHPDSIALFTTLGAEPRGRWVVGLAELAAVILLVRPATAFFGGVLGIVLMIGAIGAHLTNLGVAYNGDPSLFVMALIVLVASLVVVALRRGASRPPRTWRRFP
jgi:uncharacterized membrane protein YphA (DoxX/SURF4 family)